MPLRRWHIATALLLGALVLAGRGEPALRGAEPDPQQAARDATLVEALLRLPEFDLASSAKAEAAVGRYLEANRGSETYFALVERFRLRSQGAELLELAIVESTESRGATAARLLLRIEADEQLTAGLAAADPLRAAALATALGLSGEATATERLLPLLTDDSRPAAVRTAAAAAVGRSRVGEKRLLALAAEGQLPRALHFTVANVLFASGDAAVQTEAAKYFELPRAADSNPLPPLAELVKLRGDPIRGRQLYATTGTCAKCHKVRGEGKEVGPDLSEIGSKLARQAMYVSILDPSAGISHNYESYVALLDDGNAVTGIKLSEDDESITLKTVEAIERRLDKPSLEGLKKQEISLMPADLQKLLTAGQLADVVEYLLTLKKPAP